MGARTAVRPASVGGVSDLWVVAEPGVLGGCRRWPPCPGGDVRGELLRSFGFPGKRAPLIVGTVPAPRSGRSLRAAASAGSGAAVLAGGRTVMRMRIVIAGGHGQVALRLERLVYARGYEGGGGIRKPGEGGGPLV